MCSRDPRDKAAVVGEPHEFVSITVAGQLFGIPVLQVQDVLGPQRITPHPAGAAGSRGLAQSARPHRHRHRSAHAAQAAASCRTAKSA